MGDVNKKDSFLKRTIKIDIQEVVEAFPGEWPCLDYCVNLLKSGEKRSTKLECWNFKREIPEADWTVQNIGKYADQEHFLKKQAKSISSI